MQIFVNRTSKRHSYDEQQDDDDPEEATDARSAAFPKEVKDNTNAFQSPAQKAEDYKGNDEEKYDTDDFHVYNIERL